MVSCATCSKAVYYNDPQVYGKSAHLYHKSCFKCTECACQLTLNTFAYHGDVLLCKTHYMSFFRTTNSYGGEDKFKKQKDDVVSATVVKEIAAAAAAAAPAPAPLAPLDITPYDVNEKPTKVSPLRDSLSSNPFLRSDSNRGIRSSSDAPALDQTKRISPNNGASKVKRVFGGSPKCTLCAKSVYANDLKTQLEGKIFHQECFKCANCSTQLNLNNFTFAGDQLLCKVHYMQSFHKNNGYAGGEQFTKK
ncbi:hypothetical protein H310_13982 [Aphanomyces invadans]|uniref:LIM zinc-binding domain-containing protein n=1 Tax=Aphanomyces invadans TaxID=157072 RepID=A0A024TBN7_9STRA|nr:hypothetical protein H310_13982 [Aphanomyces invadans]ETV91438.1 hypothetical protein H310_13982 [Aphanomyces invadans]|eukprot:XP_008879890.1 hypothetical protein H310_13982 [Aphanomyces invadans]